MKMAILEGGQTSIVDLFSSLPLLIETAIKEFYIYIVSESNITISELLVVIAEMSLNIPDDLFGIADISFFPRKIYPRFETFCKKNVI